MNLQVTIAQKIILAMLGLAVVILGLGITFRLIASDANSSKQTCQLTSESALGAKTKGSGLSSDNLCGTQN
jgi:uncharacterized membrane protein